MNTTKQRHDDRQTRGQAALAARATYRLLGMKGFAPTEAGNLTAYLAGLAPVESGWTPREIERILFLRHLVQKGPLAS
jgi:hypothetical protein